MNQVLTVESPSFRCSPPPPASAPRCASSEYLVAYLDGADCAAIPRGPLFRTIGGRKTRSPEVKRSRSRGRRRRAITVQSAPVNPPAEFRLSGADFGDQHDRIGNSLQLAQPRLACIVDGGVRQDAIRGNNRRAIALDDARADPRLLPQLERRLEQVCVQPGGGIEPGQALPADHSRRADAQSRRSFARPGPDHSSGTHANA